MSYRIDEAKKQETRSWEDTWYAALERYYKEDVKLLRWLVNLKKMDEQRVRPVENPVQEKYPYVIDGTMLYLTAQQILGWKQHESAQETAREEREERRRRDEQQRQQEKEEEEEEERKKEEEAWREDARRRGCTV